MDLSTIAVDDKKVNGGVWWDFETKSECPNNVPHPSHGCLLILPSFHRFRSVMDEERLPFMASIRAGKLSPADELIIRGRCLARGCVRGWANISLRGKPLEYSEATAIEVFTNPQWEFLRIFVEAAKNQDEAYMAKEEAAAMGNSLAD